MFKRKKGKYEIKNKKDLTLFQLRMYQTLATTSKQLVWLFSINGCIWIWCSYILAFMGKDQVVESLSSTVCTVIVGTLIAYLVTSTVESIFKYNDFGGKGMTYNEPTEPDAELNEHKEEFQ